jgi:hypothetical protein
MDGPNCPVHGKPMHWLSTINQWEYHCPVCDMRYNRKLEPKPVDTGFVCE